MKGKERIERRNSRRYPVKKGAFAAVRPLYAKIGRVTDICKGGLAFRYMDTGSQERGARKLDIFVIGNAFRLDKIPVKIISDLDMPKESSSGSFAMRHCRVEFSELDQTQTDQLDYFIQHYTLKSNEHVDQRIREDETAKDLPHAL